MSDHVESAPVRRFRPATEQTTEIIADAVRTRTPVFAMPSWFVTADSAHVGFLLSAAAAAELSTPEVPYRSFFANSGLEALHGAIKLVRHRELDRFDRHGGRVLVLDPDDALRARFDPFGAGPDRALVPAVEFTDTVVAAGAALTARPRCGLVIRSVERYPAAELADLAARCRELGGRVVLDLSDHDLLGPVPGGAPARIAPDVLVFGEELTGGEVPFGAFTGTPEVFRPWSTPATAFLHSNTYGGNTVAMRRVKAHLAGRWPADEAAPLAEDWGRTLRVYARHVNPGAARMHRILRGALRVERADGTRLTVRLDSGRRLDLLDGLCGAGLGVNGHNPDDAITEVVDRHDPGADYVAELERVLAAETGLGHLFPAVSGATAVETAMTLALMAAGGKRRVVVFRHNYGGKTLVSLLATAADRTRAPFGPLHADVAYLDPFAPDAEAALARELASGQVGLVWVEIVHGSSDSYAPIPDALLAMVADERARSGLLVGVDEVLTSFYRCGRRFAHRGRLPAVDVVALSKALSYGCFPVGAALVSDAVRHAAEAVDPDLVVDLRTRHANDLGAHFALHAVAQVDRLGLAERTAELGREVADGVARMGTGGTVGRRFAEGLLGRFEVLPPRWLRRFIAGDGELMTFAVMLWWITRARVFVVYDVFLLPLVATRAEVRAFTSAARELARSSPLRVLATAARFLLADRIAGALRRKRGNR